jgi:hypothetical protein
LKFGSASLDDWPFNIFFVFSLPTFPFMIIKNQSNIGPNTKGNEYDKGHSKKGIEHLTILMRTCSGCSWYIFFL